MVSVSPESVTSTSFSLTPGSSAFTTSSFSVSAMSRSGVKPCEPAPSGRQAPAPSRKESKMRSTSRRNVTKGSKKSSRVAGAWDFSRQGTRDLESTISDLLSQLTWCPDARQCDHDLAYIGSAQGEPWVAPPALQRGLGRGSLDCLPIANLHEKRRLQLGRGTQRGCRHEN